MNYQELRSGDKEGITMNNFRCYVCGKPVEGVYFLVSMSPDVDRVFIVCDAGFCDARCREDKNIIVMVREDAK